MWVAILCMTESILSFFACMQAHMPIHILFVHFLCCIRMQTTLWLDCLILFQHCCECQFFWKNGLISYLLVSCNGAFNHLQEAENILLYHCLRQELCEHHTHRLSRMVQSQELASVYLWYDMKKRNLHLKWIVLTLKLTMKALIAKQVAADLMNKENESKEMELHKP